MAGEQSALEAAGAQIARRGAVGRYEVAAVLIGGDMYTGLILQSRLPRATICGAAVAIGQAAMAEPDAAIRFSVAFGNDGAVLRPCGACREFLANFGPGARTTVPDGNEGRASTLPALLPHARRAAGRGIE